MVRILQEVESGKAVREVCRAHGVSEGTFYTWKRKYAGMQTQDVRRLRELEAENSELKRIVADQALIIDATGKLIRKKDGRSPKTPGSAGTDGTGHLSAIGS